VAVFPAFRRLPPKGALPETVLVEGEAACFYHATKRAVVPCAECGRFLCALCDVQLHGRHLCPNCLEAGRRKAQFTELETGRTLLDGAALQVAIVTLLCPLFWFIGAVTGPLAIVLAIRSWFRPGSLVPRTRIRAYAAIMLGLGGIAICTFIWLSILET
jgi:hypothetical protein